MKDQRRDKIRPGILLIHERGCQGVKCRCGKDGRGSYQASVWSAREGKNLRKHFPALREAEYWRSEARVKVARGELRAPTRTTVGEALDALLDGMRDGTVCNRSGAIYKPSTIRRYEISVRTRLAPAVGRVRIAELDRAHIRSLVDGMHRAGQSASSIRNALDPLRCVIREVIHDGAISVDPFLKVKLPSGKGRRDRVADRTEAEQLLAALPDSDRALWATAFYGGLRRGELRALKWDDVDLEAGVIRVSRTWDDVEGATTPKTEAGEREVPIARTLRLVLVAHKLATGRGGDDLVFGRTATTPFAKTTVTQVAMRAWGWKRVTNPERDALPRRVWIKDRDDALVPIALHEARHSAASYLIEAGLNDLELTATIGHSDPRTTKSIYGHLFNDSRESIARKLDAYLEAASQS